MTGNCSVFSFRVRFRFFRYILCCLMLLFYIICLICDRFVNFVSLVCSYNFLQKSRSFKIPLYWNPITTSCFNGYNINSSLSTTLSSLKADLFFLILILLLRCWSFFFTICSSTLHLKYIWNLFWYAFSSIRTEYEVYKVNVGT